MVVKYGTSVDFRQAESLNYVAANTNIRVGLPKVLAIFSDYITHVGRRMEERFIVMDYIPGETFESLWSSLTKDERMEIGLQVKVAIGALRSLSPPDYLGGINQQQYVDAIFMTWPIDPTISGPFKDEDAMNEGMLRRMRQLTDEPFTNLTRSMVSQVLTGHRTVFTHGDIQARNIIVERINDVGFEGKPRFRIALVDFEMSGWYPEYWDFSIATYMARYKPEWHELMQKAPILEPYPLPYLLLAMIRNIIYV